MGANRQHKRPRTVGARAAARPKQPQQVAAPVPVLTPVMAVASPPAVIQPPVVIHLKAVPPEPPAPASSQPGSAPAPLAPPATATTVQTLAPDASHLSWRPRIGRFILMVLTILVLFVAGIYMRTLQFPVRVTGSIRATTMTFELQKATRLFAGTAVNGFTDQCVTGVTSDGLTWIPHTPPELNAKAAAQVSIAAMPDVGSAADVEDIVIEPAKPYRLAAYYEPRLKRKTLTVTPGLDSKGAVPEKVAATLKVKLRGMWKIKVNQIDYKVRVTDDRLADGIHEGALSLTIQDLQAGPLSLKVAENQSGDTIAPLTVTRLWIDPQDPTFSSDVYVSSIVKKTSLTVYPTWPVQEFLAPSTSREVSINSGEQIRFDNLPDFHVGFQTFADIADQKQGLGLYVSGTAGQIRKRPVPLTPGADVPWEEATLNMYDQIQGTLWVVLASAAGAIAIWKLITEFTKKSEAK